MDRTILHCDMNAFYASVELLSLPQLRGKPVAVCGNPDNRHGIILAKSEEAKAYGIVTAETVWQAKKKCPELILVPPHRDQYKLYSDKINEVYQRYTDMVEPFSIDESWLDVSGSLNLFGTGREIADEIRETVKREFSLTLSVGVSFNKIFAKMGSEYKKPDATTVIDRDNYKRILWPLPVRELFFAGEVTTDKLLKMGIKTIGDLAAADRIMLSSLMGKHGEQLYDYANGLDDSPVLRYSERQKIKSVGNGITFKRNLVGEADIRTAVTSLSDTVSGRLREYRMKCNGVKVDIKDPFFKTISRQRQLAVPTNLCEEIVRTSMEIIHKSWNMKDPIRLITITGINLQDESEAEQLSLFIQENHKRDKLEKMERAMDQIRNKYGGKAIVHAGVIKNTIGIDQEESDGTNEKEDQ